MKRNKKIDLLIVFILLGITAGISLIFHLKPLIVFLLCLLLPSLYLILRKKKNFLKTFWAVIIFGVIFGFGFDFVVTLNEGWIVTQLVFPFRLFGFYPLIDDILAFMLMTLFIVVFYEHFLDDEKNRRISKNLIWALVPSLVILVFIIVTYFINPEFLRIPYTYLLAGLAAIIMPLALSLSKPRFLIKFIKLSVFFFEIMEVRLP